MPETDQMGELSEAAINELVGRLHALKAELEVQIADAERAAQPVILDQAAVGRLSRIDAIQHQALAQASLRKAQTRLGSCHAALAAADRGEYGLCRRCEEPIGLRRLRATPEAALCIDCQGGARR